MREMLNCGAGAMRHLAAFSELFPLEVARIYDFDAVAKDNFSEETTSVFKGSVIAADSAEEAVEGADIICRIPHSVEDPIVFEPWIPPGCFVSGVGKGLDPIIAKKSDKWVIGYPSLDKPWLKTMWELSDTDLGLTYADMGEIVNGEIPGRENNEERIIYSHFGFTGQDVALGIAAYNKALKRGVGIRVKVA